MEEYLYHIITKYIDNDEIIGKTGLESILFIYKMSKNLDNYINEINFTDYYDSAASYGGKDINFNYERILDNTEEKEIYKINFSLVSVLLHEMNHAEHSRIVDKIMINPENQAPSFDPYIYLYNLLVVLSHYYFRMDLNEVSGEKLRVLQNDDAPDLNEKFRVLYRKNHDFFPDERYCNIEAYKYLKTLVCKYEKDEKKFKDYIDYLDYCYYFYIIKDYELPEDADLISPVENFITKFAFEDQRDLIIRLRKEIEKKYPYNKLALMTLGVRVDFKTYSNLLDYLIYISDEEDKKIYKR